MQSGTQPNSWFLCWRYRVLADEALAYARILRDPSQRRIFEELAAQYLKLAARSPQIAPATA